MSNDENEKKPLYEDLQKSLTHVRPRPEGNAPTERPSSGDQSNSSSQQPSSGSGNRENSED